MLNWLNVHQDSFPPEFDGLRSRMARYKEWQIDDFGSTNRAYVISHKIWTPSRIVLTGEVQVGGVKGKVEEILNDGTLVIGGKKVSTGDVQVLHEVHQSE